MNSFHLKQNFSNHQAITYYSRAPKEMPPLETVSFKLTFLIRKLNKMLLVQ